jgi:tetratricopeptide (TPR) repeat protein
VLEPLREVQVSVDSMRSQSPGSADGVDPVSRPQAAALSSGEATLFTDEPAPGGGGTATAEAVPEAPRRAWVSSGSDVVIRLPGSGWLYVGREYGVGAVVLRSKRNVAGDDEFVFSFSEEGEYGLWFQQQNSRSGELTNERLQLSAAPQGSAFVDVSALPQNGGMTVSRAAVPGNLPGATGARSDLPGADTAEAENARGEAGEAETSAGADYSLARSLSDAGDGEGAFRSYVSELTAYPESATGELYLEIADAAENAGRYAEAANYLREAIASGGAAARDGRARLYDLSITAEDGEALADAVDLLRDAGELDAGRMRRAAFAAASMDEPGPAIDLFGDFLEMPGADGRDEIYYTLAGLLEQPGPYRDLTRAVELYGRIISEYPLSRRWESSSARIEHIRRHYIDVR